MSPSGVYGPIIQGKAAAQPAAGGALRKAGTGRKAAPIRKPPAASAADTGGKGVLGLLMQRWPEPERPFGSQTALAQTVSTLARTEGMEVICFGPEDVDQNTCQVRAARFLGPKRGWAWEAAPLPDVLWNRYLRRDQEELLAWLSQQGISLLNSGYLNKWKTYQCLLRDQQFRPHLPETALLTDAGVAVEMLERHPVIFLKPLTGSAGRGILRAEAAGAGLMRLSYISVQTGGMKETHAGRRQVDRWLASGDRAGRYIVQQGLALDVFHHRFADLRVLVQKDGQGRWGITGMGGRVAVQGRFTANLHTGGQGVPAEVLLEAIFPDGDVREAARRQVEALALRAACRIEEWSGPMGELGLDFGIDRNGGIWLIEQNGQPGRAIFEHMGRWDLSDLAHLRPVQYARYLAAAKGAGRAVAQAT